MKFRIAKDELIRALSRVQGIVEKRSTNPIIANVLLEVSDAGMRVSATDTEVAFVGRYEVECIKEGSLTLAARQLFDIARLVPTDQVEFDLAANGSTMQITSGKSSFKVLGLAAEDFPAIPDPGEMTGFKLEGGAVKALVDKTLFSISSDDTRSGLNGAYVEPAEVNGRSLLRFIATDGHRLSISGQPFAEELTDAPRSVLLPKKGLAELRKLVDEGNSEEPWKVAFTDTQAVFQRGNVAFSMRLLEGDFPDYNQVVPSQWQRRLVVDRDALLQALRRVSILAPEKSHPVRFAIEHGRLVIVARQPEAGEAREEVEAQVEGDDLAVGFNARYFLDALNVISGDTVAVEMGDSLSPCLVKPGDGDSDESFVIMPMRLE
ncbi:MAG: DNA polymerase III subunit beta [Rickettsiales bacterium]|nr:DNA polymerase III subunit beta [Rickettsiales bacterium]|tara:strand:- start:6771 stop:7901 length:1131 start_codon:yes stop_codon:yes gene_type:complete